MGRLDVSFESSSAFLAGSLPIEVRDAAYRLVMRRSGRLHETLPDGLYLVRATLPGGRNHEEVVTVDEAQPVSLTLNWNGDMRARLPEALRLSTRPDPARDLFATAPGDDAAEFAGLVGTHGCIVESVTPYTWRFTSDNPLTETPYAVFALGGRQVQVSLPVNPVPREPNEAACVVAAVSAGGRDRLVTSFVRQRRVAATLEGLIRSHSLLFASDLLDHATELLFNKYYDPAAAALGGLTLHRLGRLEERAGWIENLARDFPWLPDGQVLLAAVLARHEDPHEQARGQQTLLAVTGRRMLFTDGLALQLDLLRRWPGGAGSDPRAAALATVAPAAASVDWDAVALTSYEEPTDRGLAPASYGEPAYRETATLGTYDEPVH
jgi:hypothetical protein